MASALCCAFPQRTGSPDLPNTRPTRTARGLVVQSTPAIGLGISGLEPDQQLELRSIFDINDEERLAQPKWTEAAASEVRGNEETPSLVKRLKKRLSRVRTRSNQSTRETAKLQKQKAKPDAPYTSKESAMEDKPEPSILSSPSPGGYDTDARSLRIIDTPTPFLRAPSGETSSPNTLISPMIRQKLKDSEQTLDQPSSYSHSGDPSCLPMLIDVRVHYLQTPDADVQLRRASQVTIIHAPTKRQDEPGLVDHGARLARHRSRSESFIGSVRTVRKTSSAVLPRASVNIEAYQALPTDPARAATGDKPSSTDMMEKSLPCHDQSEASIYESAASRIEEDDQVSSASASIRGEVQPKVQQDSRTHETDYRNPRADWGSDTDNVHPVQAQAESTEPRVSSAASIHLWSMRISHHLRSGSTATANTTRTTASELPSMRPASSMSDLLSARESASSRRRQQSSSGFASAKVPAAWGKVVRDAHTSACTTRSPTPAQSIQSFYSSRNSPILGSADTTVLTPAAKPAYVEAEAFVKPRTLRRNSYGFELLHPRPTSDSLIAPANSSASSSRSSRFKEDIQAPVDKPSLPRRPSLFNLFRSSKSKAVVTSDNTTVSARYDGAADTQDTQDTQPRRTSQDTIPPQGNDEASSLFARALRANQEEKAALMLPENRDKLGVPLHSRRQRSRSVSSKSTSSIGDTTDHDAQVNHLRSPSPCLVFSTPEATATQHKSPTSVVSESHVGTGVNVTDTSDSLESQNREFGAWGRYPSHTLEVRTGSAGEADNVKARDFALSTERSTTPTGRGPSAPPKMHPGSAKWAPRKFRRIGLEGGGPTRLSKAKSMTLNARRAIAGYSQMFKSQSLEFATHGHGHRTSMSAGGALKHPELELLPPVFPGMSGKRDRGAIELSDMSNKAQLDGCDEPNAESAMPVAGSTTFDAATIWSQVYASCVDLPLSRTASPGRGSRQARRSREQGHIPGRRSISSPASTRPTSPLPTSIEEAGAAGARFGKYTHGKRDSVVSVASMRESTQDLCMLLVEAEMRERDRLLRAAEELFGDPSLPGLALTTG